jgi:UPF0716 protein FxsA
MKILLLFLSVPVIETLLLYLVHLWLGFWNTIALIVVTAVVGWYFARSQGMRTMRGIRMEMGSGQLPAESLLDGGLILVAGILLMVPGLLTDVLGFGLLVPLTRGMIRRSIANRFLRGFHFTKIATMGDEFDSTPEGVVEGKVVGKEEIPR